MTSTEHSGADARTAYLALWRTVPRELGFLVLTLPIAVVGFSAGLTLFFGGVGSIPAFLVGFGVLVVALFVARGFGTLELVRLGWAGRTPITRPVWPDDRSRGFWRGLWAVLSNGHYWLYLLHTALVNFVVSLFTWIVTVVWVSVTLFTLTFWFFRLILPEGTVEWNVTNRLFDALPAGFGRDVLESVVAFVAGVAMLALLPIVTRGLVLLHDVIARVTLGAFPSEALRTQVGDLEASRGAAQSAEGHSLRRLERDIHDGPQQRLVRLQMDLAAADRQLDADPDRARTLIAEAMQQSKDALEELRALSRGFAPPILLDRGLVAALESSAVRSSVPVSVVSELPAGLELPQEIERNAYFVASEALTNAAKHSGATTVEARVAVRRVLDTDDTWLDVTVTDDGRGGAVPAEGHGLAGLDERLRGLGGTLELDSPAGGPTVVAAHLPLAVSLSPSVAPPTLGA
jgi:signal transduction histidine kinase